jgi:hypothetical protein
MADTYSSKYLLFIKEANASRPPHSPYAAGAANDSRLSHSPSAFQLATMSEPT